MLQFDGVVIKDLTNHVVWIERSDMVEDSTQTLAEFYDSYPGKGGSLWIVYTLSKNAAGEIISISIAESNTQPGFIP